MKEFDELLSIVDRLMAPDGCPWDREQTLMSMRSSFLEEICEYIEAIDLQDDIKIKEELGDCFFNAVFSCRLTEKEGRFDMPELLTALTQKLIRRHPHVFGEESARDTKEALSHWESVKDKDKSQSSGNNLLSDLPRGLPSLMLAQKILKRMAKAGYVKDIDFESTNEIKDEESLGKALLKLVQEAHANGLDAEQALRKAIVQLEKCSKKG